MSLLSGGRTHHPRVAGFSEPKERRQSAIIKQAQFEGELELTSVVRQCGNGWQGSAWLLERTRGYVARASLEHTGKGGKELSISGSLLGAFGGQK